jgi:hypothetical protein
MVGSFELTLHDVEIQDVGEYVKLQPVGWSDWLSGLIG